MEILKFCKSEIQFSKNYMDVMIRCPQTSGHMSRMFLVKEALRSSSSLYLHSKPRLFHSLFCFNVLEMGFVSPLISDLDLWPINIFVEFSKPANLCHTLSFLLTFENWNWQKKGHLEQKRSVFSADIEQFYSRVYVI